MNAHTSIHPYIHTSIHPYMHAYIHVYMHEYKHTYIQTNIHANIHTYSKVPKDFPGGGSQHQLVPHYAAFEKLQGPG